MTNEQKESNIRDLYAQVLGRLVENHRYLYLYLYLYYMI